MKKTLLAVVALLFAGMAFADPSVSITVDQVTPTTITCSFAKNADCVEYYIVASEPEGIEPWVGSPAGGATLEETVVAFGIKYTDDTTYTWEEMIPNTMFVIYVAAKDAAGALVLCTDTANTPSGGGHGESVVTVRIEDITAVGATTIATPNDQTFMFKDLVLEMGLYDNIRAHYDSIDTQTAEEETYDSLFRMLKEYYYEYYEEDRWVWINLDANTEYMFIAAGMNADSIWGEMATTSFKTLGGDAVEYVEENTISVYPNPATEFVMVSGLNAGEVVTVFDVNGRVVAEKEAEGTEVRISLGGVVPGVYMVRTENAVQKVIVK